MADAVNASIVEHCQTVQDPRIERTKQHPLLDILVIAVCTLLTGGEGFQDMELFGQSQHAWLQTFLALPHGMPSHDTLGRVFARLKPQRFQACFLSWTQAVAQLTQGRSSRAMAQPCGPPLTAPQRLPPCPCSRRGVLSKVAS